MISNYSFIALVAAVVAITSGLRVALMQAAAVAALNLLKVFLRHFNMQWRRPGEPPVIWSWVPILGLDVYVNVIGSSIIDLMLSYQKKTGHDVFVAVAGGQRTVYLINPNDYRTALYNSTNKDVTFTPFVQRAMNAFGATSEVTAQTRHELLTSNVRHVLMGRTHCDSPQDASSVKDVSAPTNRRSSSTTKKQNFAEAFFSRVNSSLDDYFVSEETTDAGSFLHKAETLEEGCNLFDLALDMTQYAIFGALLDDSFKDRVLRKAMSDFDALFPLIFIDLFPKFLLRSGLESRERVVRSILGSPSAVWGILSQKASTQQVLAKLSEHERTEAAIKFSFIWASIGQAGPTSFWTILHILSNPKLRKVITEEIRGAVGENQTEGEGEDEDEDAREFLASSSSPRLTKNNSLRLLKLESVILESLRMYTAASGVRAAEKDATITDAKGTKYRIREGDWINGAYFVVHKDDRFFEDPEEFRWNRFLGHIEKNAVQDSDGRLVSREVLPKNHFAFGGGKQQCPGRKLALMTIKSVVSRFLLDFEKVELVNQKEDCGGPSGPVPVCKADQSIYGVGMFRPTADVRVRIQTKKQKQGALQLSLDSLSLLKKEVEGGEIRTSSGNDEKPKRVSWNPNENRYDNPQQGSP